jgi:alkylated DNA repair protein alkB family protein 8
VVANCLCLPYRDDSFDAALSIAVLHHISSLPRRQRLVAETMRILRPGGRALFYAWAQEQHDGRSGRARPPARKTPPART